MARWAARPKRLLNNSRLHRLALTLLLSGWHSVGGVPLLDFERLDPHGDERMSEAGIANTDGLKMESDKDLKQKINLNMGGALIFASLKRPATS